MPFKRKDPTKPLGIVRPVRSRPMTQLLDFQDLMYDAAQEDGIDKRELAQLACAWERLEERKRVMRGRPAPKPLEVDKQGNPIGRGKRGSISRQASVKPAFEPTPIPLEQPPSEQAKTG